MLNGANKEASSSEGVVDNEGDTLLLADLGNALEIGDVVLGVADGLDVDGFGLVVDGGGDVRGVVTLDKLGGDTKAGEHDLELVVGTAVEVRGGDDVVTGLGKGGDGHELGGLAGGGGDGSDTTFKGGHSLLKDIDGGLGRSAASSRNGLNTHVTDTGVDVAKLLEPKKTGTLGRVVKDIRL